MHDVTCPHCLVALTVPPDAETVIRCPECDGVFEQGEPPSLERLAHLPEREAIAERWGISLDRRRVSRTVDDEVAALTGPLADGDLVRSPIHSLSPATMDAEPAPLPEKRPARSGWLGLSVGIAGGIAAAAVLTFGAARNSPRAETASPVRAAGATAPAREVAPAAPAGVPAPKVIRIALLASPAAASAAVPRQKNSAPAPHNPTLKNRSPAAADEAPSAARATAESGAAPANSERPADRPPFDRIAAMGAIASTEPELKDCYDASVGAGTTGVAVTFAPTGRVSLAVLEGVPVFGGTPVAGCVISRLRKIEVSPFAGEHVTLHTRVSVN
jgi:hypothetical protein